MEVRTSCQINRPLDEVRAQFADVQHHVETQVHRNVRFEPLTGFPSRFRQVTRKGPLRFRQEIEMEVDDEGAIVQRVIAGSLRGSTLTFGFAPAGSGTAVTARAQVPLRGPGRLASILLSRSIRRALATALEEDRVDLESAPAAPTRPPTGPGPTESGGLRRRCA